MSVDLISQAAIWVLTMYIGVLVMTRWIVPWTMEIHEPLDTKNLEYGDKKVTHIHYGNRMFRNRIDVAQMDDFNALFMEIILDADPERQLSPYTVQIGYDASLNMGGQVIHSEIECPNLISAYITARAKQQVLKNQIKHNGIFYRITRKKLS